MAMRDAWIEKRAAAMNGGGRNSSQMYFARKGRVTKELDQVAKREKLAPDIIPANIHHRSLEPMGIGVAFFCKIDAPSEIPPLRPR
jgi:phosphomethylpyrimidine synthase